MGGETILKSWGIAGNYDFSPSMGFGVTESTLIYLLVIVLISSILSDYFSSLVKSRAFLTRISSFLLIAIFLANVVFMADNALVDAIVIIFGLLLSLATFVIQKILLAMKAGAIVER